MRSLAKILESAAHKIKLGLKLNERPIFVEVPAYDKLEQTRIQGLQAAYEYREKQERYELMQALPISLLGVEVESKPDPDGQAEAKEALLLAEIRSEEERQKKLRTPSTPTPTPTNDEIIQEEYL